MKVSLVVNFEKKDAKKIANEVIDKLGLLYNRARQQTITNELIDIIGGASAVE